MALHANGAFARRGARGRRDWRYTHVRAMFAHVALDVASMSWAMASPIMRRHAVYSTVHSRLLWYCMEKTLGQHRGVHALARLRALHVQARWRRGLAAWGLTAARWRSSRQPWTPTAVGSAAAVERWTTAPTTVLFPRLRPD